MSNMVPKQAAFCQDGLLIDVIVRGVTGCMSFTIYTMFILEEELTITLTLLQFLKARKIAFELGFDIVIVGLELEFNSVGCHIPSKKDTA